MIIINMDIIKTILLIQKSKKYNLYYTRDQTDELYYSNSDSGIDSCYSNYDYSKWSLLSNIYTFYHVNEEVVFNLNNPFVYKYLLNTIKK